MRLGIWALVACCGCGRFGFEEALRVDGGDDGDVAAADGRPDAADVPFVEATGVPDPTFAAAGRYNLVGGRSVALYDHAPRPGGGYFAAGVYGDSGGATTADFLLLGLDATGALDDGFTSAGLARVGPTDYDYAYGITRMSDTRYVIAGDGDDQLGVTFDDLTIGMADELGAPVPAFGTGGFVRVDIANQRDTGNDVAIVGNDIVVCGTANYEGPDSHFVLLRLTATGQRVASFGQNGLVVDDFGANTEDECTAVVARPGGGVIAVGHHDQTFLVAAYDDVGAPIAAFGTGGNVKIGSIGAFAYGVMIASDGDLVAVGEDQGSSIIVKLSPDGTPRAGFGTNGIARFPPEADLLASVIEQPNGKLVASGFHGDTGVIVRFDRATGALDPTFAGDGAVELVQGTAHVELTGLHLEAGGRLVVSGRIGATDPYSGIVARYE